MLAVVTIRFFIISFTFASGNVIFVDSSKRLQHELNILSRTNQTKDTILELNSSQEFKLSKRNFSCITNKTITLKSSDPYHPVNIFCDAKEQFSPTTGLAFVNSTVTIVSINFIFCGTHLKLLPKAIVHNFNSTLVHFSYSRTSAAALLFVDSKVHIHQLMMKSSYGFAIVGHNLVSLSNFTFLNLGNSVHKSKVYYDQSIGNGMLIYFSDSSHRTQQARQVYLSNSIFQKNIENSVPSQCFRGDYKRVVNKKILIIAGGLTILYNQRKYSAHVNITGVNFMQNTGIYAGAILIIHLYAATSSTSVKDSFFKGNTVKKCYGSGLKLYSFDDKKDSVSSPAQILFMENTSFYGGTQKLKHTQQLGVVHIGIYHASQQVALFYFRKLYFTGYNIKLFNGICISVTKYDTSSIINVTMSDIIAINNSNAYDIARSLFFFQNIKNVTFSGTGLFLNNHGSVIHAQESNVFLTGNHLFNNNTAMNGPAISLERYGLLYFIEGLNASFTNNRAYFSGGAIYVNSFLYRMCGIQAAMNPSKMNALFVNNLGTMAGNSIFVSPINRCENNGKLYTSWANRYKDYFHLSENNESNSLLPLSTVPKYLKVDYKKNDYFVPVPKSGIKFFPGKTIFFKISAKDAMGMRVFSYINSEVCCNDKERRVWMQQSGGNTALEGVDENLMNMSIHTTSPNAVSANLVLSIPNIFSRIVYYQLLPCPIGFALNPISGSCKCSDTVKKLSGTECSIDENTITIPNDTNPWMGIIKNQLVISKICPQSYCNTGHKIKSTDDEIMLLGVSGKLVSYCMGNREGVLCGQCKENFSTVFGSNECKQCSNWWLFTILIYAIEGPIIVYLLYTLKLTITAGTLNGMIFYAQVANAGLMEFLSQPYHKYNWISKIYRFCQFVLSFLNLTLGYPLCFYNGMNQLWKMGISLIFPIYLLTMVVAIIVFSRYSTQLSNRTSHYSVQVLVTVVHLSFSKLILTLIDVFTPATVHTPWGTEYVWYWDGSVGFKDRPHYLLAAITVTIVGVFLIPYIMLLVLGKPLIRHSKRANFYIRPIYEAIHAPYKEGKQYWFTARLLLLIIVYIVYVVFGTNNYVTLSLITSFLLSSFTVGQALFRPFKSKALNILDCWLMLNITLVYNTIWNDAFSMILVFNMIAVMTAVLTFGGIVTYHIATKLSRSRKLSKLLKLISTVTSGFNTKHKCCVFGIKRQQLSQQLLTTDSFYNSCTQYREPLITDLTDE